MLRSLGCEPGVADQREQVVAGQLVRRAEAVGVVGDLVLDDRAVHVVGAVVQRELRGRQPVHHPEHLDVREVVEHQPRHRERLEHVGRLGHRQVREPVVVVVEAQRDEHLEAAGLVLQLAQPQHVVDAVPRLLDVAVEHRRRRAQALLVREAVDARPVLPVRLVVDDLLAHVPVEDLGAAAGERLEPGVDELVEDLVGRQAADLLEAVDLGRGEALERDVGQRGLELAQHARVVLPRQRRVQAVDDVQLGEPVVLHRQRLLDGLLDAHRVRVLLAGLALEAAVGARRACRRWSG